MKLTSDALEDGRIPARYTKDGQNVSPPLAWSDVPDRTKELALLFENITPQTEDPFVQWLVYGIPPDRSGLPEGYQHKRDPKEPVDVLQGRNSLGNVGYDGPLGTLNRTIRYCFRLFALDQPLELSPGADREEFLAAAAGHVLEQSDLIATYVRNP
jgi:Raf kinase inhibitor-like YbhB/YbcL family protein